MLTKNCLVCGKEFTKKNNCSRKNWVKHNYCSNECCIINTGFKKGLVPWSKGKKMPDDVRKKISAKLTGQKLSPETIKKLMGRTPWNKGKRFVEIEKEKHWNWKGGRTKLAVRIRCSFEGRKWTYAVFKRDKSACIKCGAKKVDDNKFFLQAHHIKPLWQLMNEYKIRSFDDAIKCKELWDIDNGQTLCIPCHKQTDSYCGKSKGKLARS